MGIWTPQNLGANISQVVSADDLQDEAIRSHERGSTEPTDKPTGLLWWCTNATVLTSTGATALGITEAMVRWNGSSWELVADASRIVMANGKIPFTADQPMGSRKLTGLSAGSAAGHSVRYEQVMLLSGVNAMAANLAMGGFKITGGAAGNSAGEFVIREQLGDGVPNYACSHWYQTNRDVLSNSQPIVQQVFTNQGPTYTHVGRVPRRLTLRLTGRPHLQSDNSDANCGAVSGLELTVHRWDAQTAGGDAGTAGSVVAGTIDSGIFSGGCEVIVEWKYSSTGPDSNLGFYLRFVRPGDGAWCYLKKSDDDAVDGVIQAQSWYGMAT
jgi:hypothetical protein